MPWKTASSSIDARPSYEGLISKLVLFYAYIMLVGGTYQDTKPIKNAIKPIKAAIREGVSLNMVIVRCSFV